MTAPTKLAYSFGSLVLTILSASTFFSILDKLPMTSELDWRLFQMTGQRWAHATLDLTYLTGVIVPLLFLGLAILFGIKAYKDQTTTSKTRIWSLVSLTLSVYIVITLLIGLGL